MKFLTWQDATFPRLSGVSCSQGIVSCVRTHKCLELFHDLNVPQVVRKPIPTGKSWGHLLAQLEHALVVILWIEGTCGARCWPLLVLNSFLCNNLRHASLRVNVRKLKHIYSGRGASVVGAHPTQWHANKFK